MLAECALVWLDTHDAEATKRAHETVCVPMQEAWDAMVWKTLREAGERLDRECMDAITRRRDDTA